MSTEKLKRDQVKLNKGIVLNDDLISNNTIENNEYDYSKPYVENTSIFQSYNDLVSVQLLKDAYAHYDDQKSLEANVLSLHNNADISNKYVESSHTTCAYTELASLPIESNRHCVERDFHISHTSCHQIDLKGKTTTSLIKAPLIRVIAAKSLLKSDSKPDPDTSSSNLPESISLPIESADPIEEVINDPWIKKVDLPGSKVVGYDGDKDIVRNINVSHPIPASLIAKSGILNKAAKLVYFTKLIRSINSGVDIGKAVKTKCGDIEIPVKIELIDKHFSNTLVSNMLIGDKFNISLSANIKIVKNKNSLIALDKPISLNSLVSNLIYDDSLKKIDINDLKIKITKPSNQTLSCKEISFDEGSFLELKAEKVSIHLPANKINNGNNIDDNAVKIDCKKFIFIAAAAANTTNKTQLVKDNDFNTNEESWRSIVVSAPDISISCYPHNTDKSPYYDSLSAVFHATDSAFEQITLQFHNRFFYNWS